MYIYLKRKKTFPRKINSDYFQLNIFILNN